MNKEVVVGDGALSTTMTTLIRLGILTSIMSPTVQTIRSTFIRNKPIRTLAMQIMTRKTLDEVMMTTANGIRRSSQRCTQQA